MAHHRHMRMRRTAVGLALTMVVTGCSSKEGATEERIREGLPDDSVVATVMDDQPTESRELDLPPVSYTHLTLPTTPYV